MKCPHCGQEHPDDTKFCPETGQKISLPKACQNKECRNFGKHILRPEARFCPECGQPLEAGGDPGGATLEFNVGGVPFKMIRVQGGTFTMGATREQDSDSVRSDEKPTHRVTLSDYYIGEFEVTQDLWQAVMGSNPSYFKGDNLPVENVRWYDAVEFCNRLSEKTGRKPYYSIDRRKMDPNNENENDDLKWTVRANPNADGFRLPTEAEWEYAARGGNRSRGYKYSGSDSVDDVAWFWENSGDRPLTGDWDYDRIENNNCKTHPVGTKLPNELGVYDLSGNVCEWCQDWFGSYGSGSQTNPQGPSSGSYRVLRGGGWNFSSGDCRVSFRFNDFPFVRFGIRGFRLVLIP